MKWGAAGQRQGLPEGQEEMTLRIPQDVTVEKESSLGINQEDANIIRHLPSLQVVSSTPYISFQPPSLLTLEESQATWGEGAS